MKLLFSLTTEAVGSWTLIAMKIIGLSPVLIPLFSCFLGAVQARDDLCEKPPCLAVCGPRRPIETISNRSLHRDFVNYSAIPEVYNEDLTLDNETNALSPTERFRYLFWEPCDADHSYVLFPDYDEEEKFYMLKNGSLFLPNAKAENAEVPRMLDSDKYCLRWESHYYQVMYCIPKSALDIELTRTKESNDAKIQNDLRYSVCIAVLVSVPFLIATVVVYSILPPLINIHGKTLRCYWCCLICTFLMLAIPTVSKLEADTTNCLQTIFTTFFILASFLWLNVICFDVWWTSCGSEQMHMNRKEHDSRRLIIYSTYAWGVAVLLTTILIVMEFVPSVEINLPSLHPGLRKSHCVFKDNTTETIYVYGPIGVIVSSNICLFLLTSRQFIRRKKQTAGQLNNEYSECHDDNKKWFVLYIKLFFLMGISWATEVISWFWKDLKYVWYATDLINALQGFFIFVIFVCEKRIWKLLEERFNKPAKRLQPTSDRVGGRLGGKAQTSCDSKFRIFRRSNVI